MAESLRPSVQYYSLTSDLNIVDPSSEAKQSRDSTTATSEILSLIGVVSPVPTTRGQLVLRDVMERSISSLSIDDFGRIFSDTRRIALTLQKATDVRRVAMACDGDFVNLIPLHGLPADWKPIKSIEDVFYKTYPGYFTTINGPTAAPDDLKATQDLILASSGTTQPFDYRFYGDKEDNSIFARIVRGEMDQWRVWEDEEHAAFLTPFANTKGFTVLVPRRHLSSDVFSLDQESYEKLVRAAWVVREALKKAFRTKRVGVFFEGYEIDYTHAKLIPAHGDDDGEGREEDSDTVPKSEYFKEYPGYITTQPGPWSADGERENEMKELARKIRKMLEE